MLAMKSKISQTASEYAIFFVMIVASFVVIQKYYHRAVKGNIKARTNMIGEQFNLNDGRYVLETHSVSDHQVYAGSAASQSGLAGTHATVNMISSNNLTASNNGPDFSAELSAAGAKFSKSYAGGEVSGSEYKDVNNQDKHGVAELGKINSNNTLAKDLGIE
jgi:hypothetical protein